MTKKEVADKFNAIMAKARDDDWPAQLVTEEEI